VEGDQDVILNEGGRYDYVGPEVVVWSVHYSWLCPRNS